MDLAKFKKISSDKDSTTLEHPDGHSFKVAHKGLSSEMKKQIEKIPLHKKDDSKEKGEKLYKGGEVKKPKDDTPYNAKAAKEIEKGATEPGWAEARRNIKKLTGYAHGGEVTEGKEYAEESQILRKETIDKANRERMDRGEPQEAYPSDLEDTMRETDVTPRRRYAEGGMVESGVEKMSISDLHERIRGLESQLKEFYGSNKKDYTKIQRLAEGGEVAESPAAQAPVTINIGGGQPQMPDSLLNPNPGSQINSPAVTQAAPVPTPDVGSQPYGTPAGGIPAPVDQMSMAAAAPTQVPDQAVVPSADTSNSMLADPYGNKATEAAYVQGLEEQKLGLAQEASAQMQQGAAESSILGRGVNQERNALADYERNVKGLEEERLSLSKAIDEQKINPKRYIENMSTGSKIATAIGMILGGFGQGLGGGDNPAVTFLQKQIDADIKAQESEIGKKEGLLAANLKQFGNLRDAMDMTRLMKSEIIGKQLQQAAAQAKDPAAKARLLQASGTLNQNSAQMQGQLAMRRTLSEQMSKPGAAYNPSLMINSYVPKEERAAAFKEAQEAAEFYKFRDNLINAFKKVAQLRGPMSSVPGTPGAKEIDSIKAQILAPLSKTLAGRFTEYEAKTLGDGFPNLLDSDERLNRKFQQLMKTLGDKDTFRTSVLGGVPGLVDAIERQNAISNAQGQSRFAESAPVRKTK